MTITSDAAFARLLALGAGAFPHVSGSLARHLRGTESLLRQWSDQEALCLAGLYHAVYGTEGIRGSLVSVAARDAIADVVGVEAEALVYLYGACARDEFHPRIGTASERLFADRFTHSHYPIAEAQLRDFCELTLANELELTQRDEAFRARHGAELARLTARMRRLVSDAAFDAARSTLQAFAATAFDSR